MIDDLIIYWKRKLPPEFDANSPSLLPFCYYPLRIAAAEGVSCIECMRQSIELHEYSTDRPKPDSESRPQSQSAHGQELAALDSDLHSLHVWGRHNMQATHKLHSVIKFIEVRINLEPAIDPTSYYLIMEDYEHLAARIDTYSRRLETLVPVVTSLVPIADTRRSLEETANMTRVTNLALLFVPLSFVTGLFNMNDGVSGSSLKLYFAVAIPLSLFVFSIAL